MQLDSTYSTAMAWRSVSGRLLAVAVRNSSKVDCGGLMATRSRYFDRSVSASHSPNHPAAHSRNQACQALGTAAAVGRPGFQSLCHGVSLQSREE